MSAELTNNRSLASENEDLRERLREAEETLDAIRSGEVEALVMGDQIFMLQSAEAESNRFRGEVLEQISDIAVAVDLDDRLIYLNQAAESKYGVSASDVLGRKQDDLFRIRWLTDDGKAAKDKALLSEGVWRGENAHLLADGSGFYAECTIGTLTDADGNATGYLSVIRDITDRKRSEQELRKAHDELERRVEDRTKELAASNIAFKEEVAIRSRVEKQRGDLLQRLVNSQEDERRRIARDIHDKLGQRITALRLQITSLVDANAGEQSLEGILANGIKTRFGGQLFFLGAKAGVARRHWAARGRKSICRRLVAQL
jgi:PAS domain S-box-containing protein